MKHTLILIISLLFLSCQSNSQNTTNKAKNNSRVTQLLAKYKEQPHRIALNGCSFSYNETPFELGISVKDLVEILGPYDYHHLWSFVWKDLGIVCSTNSKQEDSNNIIEYIYIYIYEY